MEEKSRTRFAILIAVVLTAAVAYSFTLSMFGETPPVGLAADGGQTGAGAEAPDAGHAAARVEVTPETVQGVIATLSRYRSYSRTIRVEYLDGSTVEGALTAQVAVDGGWTRADLTSAGGVEHTIVGEGAAYRWYDGSEDVALLPAAGGLDDLAQRLPTYESVLELEPQSILAAGYEIRGGVSCVYVETEVSGLGYTERFWVSVESGLLVASETLKDGSLVYRMTAYNLESPLTGGAAPFTLPDGTVLHQPGG